MLASARRVAGQRRPFSSSASRLEFHFDTHHFVQRLEREGLNRQQAEGIMSAMAEVIDESVRNMTRNMVTKAEQEKVLDILLSSTFINSLVATLHAASGFCADQIGTTTHGEE